MMMINDNARFMMKVLTALYDRRDDKKFADIIFKTYSKLDPEKIRKKIQTHHNIIVNLSKAIRDTEGELSDEDIDEIVDECRDRVNAATVQNIKDNAFDAMTSDGDMASIVKNCEVFNKANVINTYASDVIELLSSTSSFVDLPRHVDKFARTINELNMMMSKETIQKDYRELVLLPGHKQDKNADIVGLREIQQDVQNENNLILKTGIAGFDEIIFGGAGIYAGKLTIIGSYAGGGKSITMLDLGVGVMLCEENRKLYNLPQFKGKSIVIMIITYENTILQTYRRFMTLLGFGAAYVNSLTFEELKGMMIQIMEHAPIGMIIKARDAKTESAADMANYIREVEERDNCKVVLVGHDYINLTVPTKVDQNSMGEFMDAGNVAQDIRELICKQMNIAVISAIQLKREWEDKYIEGVRKGEKMPIRCFTGASLFGGNIVKQKADNLIFVVYQVLNGQPYAEVILDKDRDGNAAAKTNSTHAGLKQMAHLFEAQNAFMENITKENVSLREYYGNDGRLAVAIPRNGLALDHTKYYADRFEVNPEAARFMNMFQELGDDSALDRIKTTADEEVEEVEAQIPMNTSSEDYEGAVEFKEKQDKKSA
jgi:hypothetical protein